MKLAISLLLSSSVFAMGGRKPCDIVNELPFCEKRYELKVISGEGSGKYLPETVVPIKATGSSPREQFVEWIDPMGIVKDPKSIETVVIMPKANAEVEARIVIGPTDPCEIDPASCEPPPPVGEDFDWSKVKKYGGPEIGIAKDVASWEITSQLKEVSFRGDNLVQKRDEFKPVPCKQGSKPLQGNFAACVKDEDGFYTCGTWDYEKCGGQTSGKILSNLKGDTMKSSFNLKKGSEICFFNTGLARTNERNQKIRTTVKCTVWPY